MMDDDNRYPCYGSCKACYHYDPVLGCLEGIEDTRNCSRIDQESGRHM